MTAADDSSLWSKRQEAALRALVDALLPSLEVPRELSDASSSSQKQQERYWGHVLSTNQHYMAALQDCIRNKLVPVDARWQLPMLLSALSTTVGTSLLFGSLTLTPFSNLPCPDRIRLLQQLATSRFLLRRAVFNSLKRLVCGLAYSFTAAEEKESDGSPPLNPYWDAMGYRGPPQLWVDDDAERVQAAQHQQESIGQALLSTTAVNQDEPQVMTCDVCIVGSGAGGCAAASVLAKAGYEVLILEKGAYQPPQEVSNLEANAMEHLYESRGLLTSEDKAIMILAGATVGGGTTVNWSCCLPLPDYVRQEWIRDFGLEQNFGSDSGYDQALQFVLERVGATDRSRVTHNGMNRKLQQGAQVMGYPFETTGNNLKETDDDSAGYVCFGDRYRNKNGGISTFLQDAVEHGAKIIDHCRVERILATWEKDRRTRRATGVECRVGDRRLTVQARKGVVLAAGSLHTPCLLQRSGFRNRNIGKHLRLHPTSAVMGFMNRSEHIDGYLQAPLTTVCNECAQGPLKNGYGAKIECPSAHPGLLAAGITWTTPEQFKARLQRLRNAVLFLTIQRDSGEGSVTLDGDGMTPKVKYVVNKADKESLIKAVQCGLLALIAGGAEEVASPHVRDSGFVFQGSRRDRPGITGDKDVLNYLSQVKDWGMNEHEAALFSAHQMGSCRMSQSPSTGAVDPNGELWECDDIFVMDGSLFPTASAANPMITILTMAHMLSKRLALIYQHRDNKLADPVQIALATKLLSQRTVIRSVAIRGDQMHPLLIGLVILVPLFLAWFINDRMRTSW